jgi:hypothetical protein
MMFLLGVNDTPSVEERNPCASGFARSAISKCFESPQLRGDPKMDKHLDHGKIFRHRQTLPGGAA